MRVRANILNTLIAWEGLEKKEVAEKAGINRGDFWNAIVSKYKPDEFSKIMDAVNELSPKRAGVLPKGLLEQMRHEEAEDLVEMAFVIALEKEYAQRMERQQRRRQRRGQRQEKKNETQIKKERRAKRVCISEEELEEIKVSPREKFVCMERIKGRTLEDIGKDIGVTKERVRQIYAKVCRAWERYKCSLNPETDGDGYGDEVDRLGLSVRARNALVRAGVYTVDGVRALNLSDLMGMRNVGLKTALEILNAADDPKAHQKDTRFTLCKGNADMI